MGILTAAGVVSIAFGAVWLAAPGPSAGERRSVAIGGLLLGAVLLAAGLL